MIGIRVGKDGRRQRQRIGLVDGVSGAASITLVLTDSADPVNTSANFNYALAVTNVSADTLTSVSAVVTLHSSLTFVSGSGSGWTVNNVAGTVTCTRAALAVGSAPTITVTVTTSATPGNVLSIANASATAAPPAVQVSQSTVVNAAPATTLTVAIDDSADPVNISTNYSYTTTVTNTGVTTAVTVSAVITLDASLTFVSGSGTGWTVSDFGQVVTCTRATLAVGAAPVITINVTAGGAALTASTTADATAGNAPAATQDVETTRIRGTTTLTVAIDDSADPVNVSTNYNYTTVVTNTGSATAETVSAVVVLDSSLTFVSGSGTGWTVNNVAGTVTCTRATLTVGAAPTITITATAGASAITASITANASAANASAATQDTETTRIRALTTIAIAIDDSADPVNVSTNYSYAATVTNTGSATAETVSAVVVLAASLTFVSGSGTGWTVNNVAGTVTCTRATLAVGAAPVITITVTAGASALTASTTADCTSANSSAATQDTETTRIRALTTLTVALTDATDPVITAVNFAYSHIVTNTGSADAENVSAPVVLDASLTFVSGSGTGWAVSHSAGTVTCTRATLAAGAAPTITITVTTGGSALTASSNANASADNASAATQSTQTTVVKLVAKDATSGIRVPNSSTQWSDFNAYHVANGTSNFPNVSPASLWLLQEASGNPADSIGSVTLTSTFTSYQQAVTGWTRLAIVGSDGGASALLNITTAPNPGTTSVMMMAIVSIPATPGAQRGIMAQGSTTITAVRHNTTAKLRYVAGAQSDLTNSSSSSVRPVLLKIDLTGAATLVYTDQEKKTGTHQTPSGSKTSFGNPGSGVLSSAAGFLYACQFTGSSAELSDAQVKALLVALGHSIPWT